MVSNLMGEENKGHFIEGIGSSSRVQGKCEKTVIGSFTKGLVLHDFIVNFFCRIL